MGALREATAAEAAGLWPAVRASRYFASQEEFALFFDLDPWRVRVSDAGEALLLSPWRAHSDLLAIRGLWASHARVGPLVDEAVRVARERGYERVLSPLRPETSFDPYRQAGMDVCEDIVALQGFAAEIVPSQAARSVALRSATLEDIPALERLDALCFDEFWRYGMVELGDTFRRERMVVAVRSDELLGYATCSLHGAAATLGRLAVAPDARRMGSGRALLADAAAWAASREAYALTLCTQRDNHVSRRLYRAAGLCELPDRYVLGVRGI